MTMSDGVKQAVITSGLYRPARWLKRRLRPNQLRSHLEEIAYYREFLPQGSLCFDVGANIGEKSEALVKAGATVVAFEPNPLVLPELKARMRGCEKWTLVNAAVGSGVGIATLLAARDHSKSSLASDLREQLVGRYHVPVVTLDAAIETFGVPAYCKIDVEGWEFEVFKGLSRPIPMISFEFHLNERGIATTLACFARLREFGRWVVNIKPAESNFYFLKEWEPIESFAAWFPGDLKQTLPIDTYGDIVVKLVE